MMQRIEGNITVHERIALTKDEFINEELQPSAITTFTCGHCHQNNEIAITPYQTGFPFFDIYRTAIISETDIVNTKMATKSASWASHFGTYLVANLPTLYFKTQCQHCGTEYLVVFGCGERQPGQWVCKISGIWRITSKH